MIRQWETKFKYANAALDKYRKRERYYRQKLSEIAKLQAKAEKARTGTTRHITLEDDE